MNLGKIALTATLGGIASVAAFQVADRIKPGRLMPDDTRNFAVGALLFTSLDLAVHHLMRRGKVQVKPAPSVAGSSEGLGDAKFKYTWY